MYKKIISFILIIAILISGCGISVLADDVHSGTSSFWGILAKALYDQSDLSENGLWAKTLDVLARYSNLISRDEVCPVSDDHIHHGHPVGPPYTYASDGSGVICVCDYCDAGFIAHIDDNTGAFSSAYEEYTQQLPAQQINSDGSFYWQSTFSDLRQGYSAYRYGWPNVAVSSHNFNSKSDFPYSFSASNSSYGIGSIEVLNDFTLYHYTVPKDGYSFCACPRFQWYSCSVIVPVAGFYTCTSLAYSSSYPGVSDIYFNFSRTHFNANGTAQVPSDLPPGAYDGVTSICHNYYYFPKFLVVPDTALNISTGDTYNIDNRVSTYVTQYLVDNSVNTTQIINETNNTYYSPITNETYDMSGWTYDYSTRTYNITYNEGDTVNITYGDENITIIEGGNTYNYYYYITPSDDPDDPGGDSSGLLAWLQEVWPNLMAKLDEIKDAIGGAGTGSSSDHWWQDSDNSDDPDDPDSEDDLGILELFKTILRGLLNVANGILDLIFDGLENLIVWIGGIGDFFGYFSPNSDMNIWMVEEGST